MIMSVYNSAGVLLGQDTMSDVADVQATLSLANLTTAGVYYVGIQSFGGYEDLGAYTLKFSGLSASNGNTLYHWDNNGATAGFGTAAGIWASPTTGNVTQGWSAAADGTVLPSSFTTTVNDNAVFGTDTVGLGSGTVTVSGTVSTGGIIFGAASGAITINGGTITLGGILPTISVANTSDTIGSVLAGVGGLAKSGSGTLLLTGVNTYTGTTNIYSGTLALSGSGALSPSTAINTSASGATFDISAISTSSTTVGSIAGASGSSIVLGSKNLIAGGDDTTTTFAGVISGAGGGSLTKTGNGTLTLTGANTYTGPTTINAGTLALSGSGALADTGTVNLAASGATFNISSITASSETIGSFSGVSGSSIVLGAKNLTAGGDNTSTNFAGVLSGTGGSLTKTGSGILTLSNASTHTGATTVSGGTLRLNNQRALQSSTLTMNGGGATVRFDAAVAGNAFTLGGLSASTAGAGYDIALQNTASGAIALTVGGNNASTTYAGVLSGSGSLIKTGTGTLTLSNASNSYSGGTTINGGTLATTADTNLGSGGGVAFNGAATWSLGSVSNATYTRNVTISDGAVATFTSGAANPKIVSGSLSGNGALIWSTTTDLRFNNSGNTFNGPITVTTGGTNPYGLSFDSLGDAAGAGMVNLGGTTSTGYFYWYGGAQTFDDRQFALSGTTGGGVIDNRGTGTLTITKNLAVSGIGNKTVTLGGTNAAANTFSGVIADSGGSVVSLSKTGVGSWTLSTANTYTGSTSINAGTLSVSSIDLVANANSLGMSSAAAANLILNGGTLRYTGSGNSTDRLFSVGTSSGTLNSSGTGAINFINTGSMGFNAAAGARTLTLAGTNTGNNTIAAAIGDNSGATALTKSGTGTWVLSGQNTNTGATSLQGGGTLTLNFSTQNNAKIATGAALTLGSTTVGVGGGTLNLAGGSFAQSVASTTLSAGGTFITRSTGTSTLNLKALSVGSGSNRGGSLSFSADGIATTDTTNTGGILGGYAVVGNDWAVNSTNAAGGPIVGLTSYTPFVQTGGTSTVNYSLTGSQTQTGATTPGSLKIIATADGQTLALGANNLTPTTVSNASGVLFTASGNGYTYNITGTGAIKASNPNSDTFLFVNDGTLNVTALVGAGTGQTVKAGSGTLILGANNNYTGNTFVNQGVLRLTHASGAGTTAGTIGVQNLAALELGNNITVGAKPLTITGTGISDTGALRNIASNTSSYAGVITIGTGGARINSDAGGSLTLTGGVVTSRYNDITVGGAGNTTVSTTAISGAGNLIKDGSGTLTLDAASTYTGTTTVSDGTLNVTGSLAKNGSADVAITPDPDGNFSTAGPKLTRTVPAMGSYAGFGSTSTGGLLTPADIRAGVNSLGFDTGVSMQWRTRKPNELPATGTHSQLPFGVGTLVSDVLKLDGMVNNGATTGQTDPFALQIKYDPSQLSQPEATAALLGYIHLDWLDDTGTQYWHNAVEGNYGLGTQVFTNVPSSWDTFASGHGITDNNLGLFLGSWGVDTKNHVAWAVLDHNSEFAVTPEPGSAVLGGLGLIALFAVARRRRFYQRISLD